MAYFYESCMMALMMVIYLPKNILFLTAAVKFTEATKENRGLEEEAWRCEGSIWPVAPY